MIPSTITLEPGTGLIQQATLGGSQVTASLGFGSFDVYSHQGPPTKWIGTNGAQSRMMVDVFNAPPGWYVVGFQYAIDRFSGTPGVVLTNFADNTTTTCDVLSFPNILDANGIATCATVVHVTTSSLRVIMSIVNGGLYAVGATVSKL